MVNEPVYDDALPVAARLESMRNLFHYWLTWNQASREREGLESNDDCYVMVVPPHWPTRGTLKLMIATLDAARAAFAATVCPECGEPIPECNVKMNCPRSQRCELRGGGAGAGP